MTIVGLAWMQTSAQQPRPWLVILCSTSGGVMTNVALADLKR